jgi:hypothetical protein
MVTLPGVKYGAAQGLPHALFESFNVLRSLPVERVLAFGEMAKGLRQGDGSHPTKQGGDGSTVSAPLRRRLQAAGIVVPRVVHPR